MNVEIVATWDPAEPALAAIRRLSIALDISHTQRDAAIAHAYLNGASVRAIADAAQMTRQGISKILAKQG